MVRPARTALQGGEHANGTPQGRIDSDGRRTATSRVAGASLAVGAAGGAPSADHLGVCGRSRRQGGCAAIAPHTGDGLQMARAVYYASAGRAASLDGTTGYISVPDNPSLRLTGFTIAAWISLSSVTGGSRIVEKGNSDSYYLYVNGSARPLVGFFDGSYHDLIGSSPLVPNTWYFLTGTYDGAVLKLYVNGIEVNSTALTSAPAQSSEPLVIGWKFGGTPRITLQD